MLLVTLVVGLRSALIAAPWRLASITAIGTFIGEVGEGMVIDTDHWRHFFLLLGMVWGLAAATRHYRQGQAAMGQAAMGQAAMGQAAMSQTTMSGFRPAQAVR